MILNEILAGDYDNSTLIIPARIAHAAWREMSKICGEKEPEWENLSKRAQRILMVEAFTIAHKCTIEDLFEIYKKQGIATSESFETSDTHTRLRLAIKYAICKIVQQEIQTWNAVNS